VSSPFPERRRADRLDELLRYAANGRRQHRDTELDAELKPLADFAMALQGSPAPAPTEDFRAGLRAMLLAKIEREGIGATASAGSGAATRPARTKTVLADNEARLPLNRRHLVHPATTPPAGPVRPVRGNGRTRAAILIGVTAGALALSGVSLASTDSVPGDPLYSVKRSSEHAQLVLAGSDAGRGQLHLDFAKSRLVESRSVPADAVDRVLVDMDNEVRAGVRMLLASALENHDGGAVDTVMAFLSQQRTELTQLRLDLPAAAGHLRASLDLLRDIETRANQVRAAIAGGCDNTRSDELGPKPDC
jgi:hypothetical protein